jgi:hypothetical protein
MFEDDKLLARALDGPIHGRDGFDHWILEDELELMGGEDGMRHVSSTLLVHGEDTGVYKTRGLLLDSGSEGVEVEHIAAKDSSSSVDNSGALLAAPADFETLGELAAFAHQTHAKDMNEVNLGTLRDVALRGLFARDNPASRLDALSMQRHVAGLNRGELPMFIYFEGSLRPWSNPGEEEIGQLIEQLPSASNRARYRAELASPASIEAPLAV